MVIQKYFIFGNVSFVSLSLIKQKYFLGGHPVHKVKIYQVDKTESVKRRAGSNSRHLAIQFFCISILETLLHLTLKSEVEISGYLSACLFQYFGSSWTNLTIKQGTLCRHHYYIVSNTYYYMTNSYRPGLKKFDWLKAGL